MFDTKIVITLRNDLAPWQALNVAAFLASGIVAQCPDVIGEPYRNRDGREYNALIAQPMVILAADQETLANINRRCAERGIRASAYVEEMFSTGHDAANRIVFGELGDADAKLVGIAFRADKKLADKISKGAKLHP